ncbi:hypothetical protein [Acinetobacter bereziniae]|uniref:hypothetical protein n=1 Tax=Acinetobacter bereziniae TaxID=106648 RepID=UPI000A63656D
MSAKQRFARAQDEGYARGDKSEKDESLVFSKTVKLSQTIYTKHQTIQSVFI